MIERERFASQWAERDGHAVASTGDDDFDRAFRVVAEDRGFALDLLDASMRRWLLDAGPRHLGVEIAGSLALCFVAVAVRPDYAEQLPRTLEGFIHHVPSGAWTYYPAERGGPQGPRRGP